MSDWLDTETKAMLQGVPPEKLAPPDTAGFTFVLLSKSGDQKRLRHGLAKTKCVDPDVLPLVLTGVCPQILATGLKLEDALLAQFELACCDSVAVFLRDAVVAADDDAYLAEIYSDLLAGEEFRPVGIEIRSVPNDERGNRFVEQFVGADLVTLPLTGVPVRQTVVGKKARFMLHWGRKIGADVGMER